MAYKAIEKMGLGKILPWVICGLGALFYSYEYVLRILPSVMTSDLMEHYQIHAAALGSLAGVYYWAYTPLQVPVGVLMDRFGPRRLLTIACLLCVIGSYMFVATSMTSVAMVGRFLVGFGSAFAFVGVLKLATIWLPADKLGVVAGLAAALGTIGGIIGVNALTNLVETIGWHETSIYAAIAGIILAVILWVAVRDDGPRAVQSDMQQTSFKQLFSEFFILLFNKQLWINGLVGCLIYLPTTVFAELWGYSYLVQAHSFSTHQAALGITALYLGFTIGAPLMGHISDRLHNRRIPLLIGSLLAATLFAILIYVPGWSTNAVYILLFCIGLSYGAQALVFAVAREIAPPHIAGTAMAMTNMIVMLAPVALQPAVGFLLDFHWQGPVSAVHRYGVGDYQFAFIGIVVGILFAAVFSCFLKETHCVPQITNEEEV